MRAQARSSSAISRLLRCGPFQAGRTSYPQGAAWRSSPRLWFRFGNAACSGKLTFKVGGIHSIDFNIKFLDF